MPASQHAALDATPLTPPAPLQLESFNGMSEQAAIAAAGSGNAAVTTPADPSIAAGANNVVEAVNSALEIYNRAGTPLAAMNINTMIRNPSGWNVRNPHVVFDPVSGLFILMVLQYNASSCGTQVAVMVSQSNPALAWTSRGTVNINSELGGGVELGTVALGLTANVIVESSDYQTCVSGTAGAFVASQTVIIQRADLTNGTLTANSSAFLVPGPLGLQPAMAPGASTVEYEVANNATCSATMSGSIAVFAITGTPDARERLAYLHPGNHNGDERRHLTRRSRARLPSSTTGDDRFLSTVWHSNALWIAGDTSCTPSGDSHARSCLNVIDVAASTAGRDRHHAARRPKASTARTSSIRHSPWTARATRSSPLTSSRALPSNRSWSRQSLPVMSGAAFITVDVSSTFYSPAAARLPWGDYSTAVQDALHPTDVWVVFEDTDGNTGPVAQMQTPAGTRSWVDTPLPDHRYVADARGRPGDGWDAGDRFRL